MSEADDSGKLRDLERVLEISRAMVSAIDLDGLLRLIVERSMELLDAERATVFLYDAGSDELVSRVAHESREIRMPADRGIAGATVRTRSVINVPDAYADERFNREIDRITGFRTRNLLAVPLQDYSGDLVGVLEVINRRGGPFGPYEISLSATLAAQAGVAIQRANLIAHYVEKQRMQRDLEIARGIQTGLLPESKPRVEGFDIAGFMQPADETGGDIYDFIRLAGGRLAIVVADAAGHGIGPALVVAEVRAMLRALSVQANGLSASLRTVNDLLGDDLSGGRFVTCFLGLLDPGPSTLTFASAGHGPILFYDSRTDQFRQEPATGLPLGAFPNLQFEETIAWQLRSGDFAVILTDGMFEAMDEKGEHYGIPSVLEMLRCVADQPAETMIRDLRTAVLVFSAETGQSDDLTAVIIKKL